MCVDVGVWELKKKWLAWAVIHASQRPLYPTLLGRKAKTTLGFPSSWCSHRGPCQHFFFKLFLHKLKKFEMKKRLLDEDCWNDSDRTIKIELEMTFYRRHPTKLVKSSLSFFGSRLRSTRPFVRRDWNMEEYYDMNKFKRKTREKQGKKVKTSALYGQS